MDRITLRQVAAEAGVSVQTVSNVLNNRTQQNWPSTRERATRIRKIANELGYRPNAAARAMRSSRSMQIGALMLNDSKRPLAYMAAFEMVLGINARLEADDYILVLVRVEELSNQRVRESRVFHEHLLDGMIVVGHFPDEVCQQVDELSPATVWLESDQWRATHCVRRDDNHAGEVVAQKVVEQGYKHVLWVGKRPDSQTEHPSTALRLSAVKQVCGQHDVGLSQIEPQEGVNRTLTIPGLREQLNKQTAVIAYDPQTALAISKHAASRGLIAGRDYGLACCDEEQIIIRAWPALSRVSNDRFRLGYEAGSMMLRTLQDSSLSCQSIMVRDEWVQGSTMRQGEPG